MKKVLLFLGLSVSQIWAQSSVSFEEVVLETRKDVQESTQELNELRAHIQAERLPLATELNVLQAKAIALRKEVSQMRNAKNLRQSERDHLQRDVIQLRQETDFVDSVFSEYRRSVEARVAVAELSFVQEHVQGSPEELWRGALMWMNARRGGYAYPGRVLDAAGREQSGTILVLGPVGYFVNENTGGVVVPRANSVLPGLYSFDSDEELDALSALANQEEAWLPLDVSGGDAIKVEEAKGSVVDHLRKGGAIVYPLLLLGLISLVMSLHKWVDLKRMKVRLDVETLDWLSAVTDDRESEGMEKAAKLASPLKSVVTAALQHRKASREHLEEIIHEHVLAVVPRLERSLGTLAVFGGVAPLLGLLGTVTGMIHTFQLVTLFGTGNSAPLSGGISEALVTTEVGLIIAIPILLVHAFLARRAKSLLGDLEQSGVQLVNVLKSSTPAV
ncbi:MotA/TolQ/ExbB proton channel family protein [Kiritimatiellota bacterium B12222]|nr:MotA/TolQ/ExbB proton channel family protein [Kiritimatiellota bacterium B12222]